VTTIELSASTAVALAPAPAAPIAPAAPTVTQQQQQQQQQQQLQTEVQQLREQLKRLQQQPPTPVSIHSPPYAATPGMPAQALATTPRIPLAPPAPASHRTPEQEALTAAAQAAIDARVLLGTLRLATEQVTRDPLATEIERAAACEADAQQAVI
jgi:hypothetical protein